MLSSRSSLIPSKFRRNNSSNYVSLLMKLVLIINVLLVVSVESEDAEALSETDAMKYLSQFGYLDSSYTDGKSSKMITEDVSKKAIEEYQAFYGLNITGVLDSFTLAAMKKPRCGIADKFGHASEHRSKRYSLQGSKWHKTHLTYKVTRYPAELSKPRIDDVMKRAFAVWEAVTPLTFEYQPSGEVDIDILFARGEHGDGAEAAFDGPGKVLAHAYFPNTAYSGDAHFDEDEPFTIDAKSGTSLLQVAAHEFGHSLGLQHSDVYSALMYANYKGTYDFQLDADDISGIQSLYGSKDGKRPGRNPTNPSGPPSGNPGNPGSPGFPGLPPGFPTFPNMPGFPSGGGDGGNRGNPTGPTGRFPTGPTSGFPRFPGIPRFPSGGGDDGMFPSGPTLGFPRMIPDIPNNNFPFGPGGGFDDDDFGINIGSNGGFPFGFHRQYTTTTGDGTHSVTVTSTRSFSSPMSSGSFSSMSSSAPDSESTQESPDLCINGTIDTIFNSANGSTFVLRGEHYWKLKEQRIADGYPRLISQRWTELPANIDAAFTYMNWKTYFFKGSQVWRYSGRILDEGFPQQIKEVFPGIPDDIDAATVWSGNGKIYFFKGSKFWRFDPTQTPHVSKAYPKPISYWEGLPDDLDAAFQSSQGLTYFFKGENYYRINDRKFAVDLATPPFPRDTSKKWFGCDSNSPAHHLAANTATMTGNDGSLFETRRSTGSRSMFSTYGSSSDNSNNRPDTGLIEDFLDANTP